MKYILVTGGVVSGVGKGIISSSLGVILKEHGIRVSAIKIDPYINVDAGTFSPYEHGEVFVLDDGGEVDLDLGNYERFLNVDMTRDNNITTGKIYKEVIDGERRGDYLGKTVQVVPHITDAIQKWVKRVAKIPVDGSDLEPEVCIVELGGTIGDIEGMPFVEAFRQLRNRLEPGDHFMSVHVSLIVELKATGEQKTKPTQNTVRDLMRLGISPDVLICRSESQLGEADMEKLSDFCNVGKNCVINVYDVVSVYHVPLLLFEQGLPSILAKHLDIDLRQMLDLGTWSNLCLRYEQMHGNVTIAVVGKYVKLSDAYASVIKALQHAAIACELHLNIKMIDSGHLELANSDNPESRTLYTIAYHELTTCDGVLVPGGFDKRGVEGKMVAARYCRHNGVPYLGVCLGMQIAVIDFVREVFDQPKANSTEFDKHTPFPAVIEMLEHTGSAMGGTQRLGLKRTLLRKDVKSIARILYGNVDYVEERHRHRYEVNPKMVKDLEAHPKGFNFVGHDDQKERMEICELKDHKFFMGVQFHPEFTSRPLKASPPYLGLILAASGRLQKVLENGRVPSPLTLLKNSNRAQGSPRVVPKNPSNASLNKLLNGYSNGNMTLPTNGVVNGHC